MNQAAVVIEGDRTVVADDGEGFGQILQRKACLPLADFAGDLVGFHDLFSEVDLDECDVGGVGHEDPPSLVGVLHQEVFVGDDLDVVDQTL